MWEKGSCLVYLIPFERMSVLKWCFKAFRQVYECSFQYILVYQRNLGFCLKAGLLHLCQKLPEAIEQALYPCPVAHASLDCFLLPQVFTSRLQQLNLGCERESEWSVTNYIFTFPKKTPVSWVLRCSCWVFQSGCWVVATTLQKYFSYLVFLSYFQSKNSLIQMLLLPMR